MTDFFEAEAIELDENDGVEDDCVICYGIDGEHYDDCSQIIAERIAYDSEETVIEKDEKMTETVEFNADGTLADQGSVHFHGNHIGTACTEVHSSVDTETHASEAVLNAVLGNDFCAECERANVEGHYDNCSQYAVIEPAEYVVTVTPNTRKGNFVGWNVTIVNPAGEFVTSRSYLNPTIDDRDAAMKAINSAHFDGFGFYFSGNDGEFRFTE